MRVLLIEPGYQPFPIAPWAPWGKMQLAAYLRTHGKYDMRIMDNAFWKGTDKGIRDTTALEVQPDIIGIGGMTLQLHDTIRIASVLRRMYDDCPQVRNGKRKRPLFVAGGVHFTFCPQDAASLFDLVVVGEGEETFLNVCNRFRDTGSHNGESYKDILGLGYKQPDQPGFILTPPRPLLAADQILPPAFDLVPWQARYDDGFITGEHVPMLMTGRGCPYDCEFCAAPALYQRKTRMFSMDMVKDMMLQLRKVYGGKSAFRIMDDTFAINNERVTEFCEMVQRDIGPTRLSCLTHCKTADAETLQLMQETGFWVVAYGVESGNDDVLKLINKKVTVEECARAFAITQQSGIAVEGLFMMGMIGDTEQSVNDTINFAVKNNKQSIYKGLPPCCLNWFQFATPFPGSRFFAHADDYGTVVTRDYTRYHHQEPVFIPNGMTAEMLCKLRERAFRETR